MQHYEETALLEHALRDRRLASFYHDARPKLGRIHWEIDPLLEGAEGECLLDSKGQQIIRLRAIPNSSAPWIVAHELGHLVLEADHYPQIWALPPWHDTTRYLCNVLEDLQIERHLDLYGFDASEMYREQDQQVYHALLDGTRFRPDPIGHANLAILFAKLHLQLEYIRTRSGAPTSTYTIDLFAAGYPRAAALGHAIISLQHCYGFDTPAAALRVYRNALDLLGLAEQAHLIYHNQIPAELATYLRT